MRNEGVAKPESYRSGGLGVGVIGLALAAVALAFGVLDPDAGFAPWAYPLIVFLAAVSWAVLVRPALRLHSEEVELRNILHTRWVPLASITSVDIGQVTVVRVGEERYAGSGFGRTRRTIRRDGRASDDTPLQDRSLAWIVEDRIRHRAAAARERAGLSGLSGADERPGEVRRVWAWPEIVTVGGSAVATLVLMLR